MKQGLNVTSTDDSKALSAASVSPNKVLAIVCVGIILANLDLFIVNVGLPNIAQEFNNANLDDLSWILNAYAIAYASLLIFFGRLAERYKRNSSFLLGVTMFTAASAACAAANNVQSLVIFRVIQAAGAALMTPASLGLLLASFPPERRSGAVRTWTAVGGFAAALGPLVGGLLVTFSWRWIFLVNVPIGIVALVIGWRQLPPVPGHPVERPNPVAALLITAGIAFLTFAIVKVNEWGWASRNILAIIAVAVVCIALFIRHCLRSSNPFIDPALFKVRQFTGAALATALFSFSFGAMLLSVVLWDQEMWGWSALKIGLAIAPGPFLVPTVSLLFSKKLIARFGAPAVIVAGSHIVCSGHCVVGLCAHHDAQLSAGPDWASIDWRGRRTVVADAYGGCNGIPATIVVCDRIRRHQHDPPGWDGDRGRGTDCHHRRKRHQRAAPPYLPAWMVDDGRGTSRLHRADVDADQSAQGLSRARSAAFGAADHRAKQEACLKREQHGKPRWLAGDIAFTPSGLRVFLPEGLTCWCRHQGIVRPRCTAGLARKRSRACLTWVNCSETNQFTRLRKIRPGCESMEMWRCRQCCSQHQRSRRVLARCSSSTPRSRFVSAA